MFYYQISCLLFDSNQAMLNIQNKYFGEERGRDLRFATSAWHAYAHEWTCQLKYNPRLNKGWGLTDGEGNERIWSDNDPLIAANRCATKQHRVDAIDLKSSHGNEVRCRNAGVYN